MTNTIKDAIRDVEYYHACAEKAMKRLKEALSNESAISRPEYIVAAKNGIDRAAFDNMFERPQDR